MKEIQEKRWENEIKWLSTSDSVIQKQITKISKDEYHIIITIPEALSLCPLDIKLLLVIGKNYPFNPPKLYFLTNFAFPHWCDWRDFFESITNWTTQSVLVDIIEKIPKFIIEYNKSLSEGYWIMSGNYYLGDKYPINILESLPVYLKRVRQKETINGKAVINNKILIISDIYFLLFDIDKKSKNTAIWTFWSNIRAWITIRRIVKDEMCVFVWRNKLVNKKQYDVSIIIPNGEDIVNLILGKMECFGINYNISKKSWDQKTGVIPNCDIEMVEKQIEEIEKQVNSSENKPTFEWVQFWMTLYDKAVSYYSAVNDPKYEEYTKKIREMLGSKLMNDFMNYNDKTKTGETVKESEEIKEDNSKAGGNTTEEDIEKEGKTKEDQQEDNVVNNEKESNSEKAEDKKEEIKESENSKEINVNDNDEKTIETAIDSNTSDKKDDLIQKSKEQNNEPWNTNLPTLKVAISNDDDDDKPIDVSSDEDEDEDEG